MTLLFSAAEFSAYLQQPVADGTYDLAHALTLDLFEGEVGQRLTDPPQAGVKSVAIAVAARSLTNPGGVRSETAGAISVTYPDGQSGTALTDGERRRLRKAVGLSAGAGTLSVAPAFIPPRIGLRRWWP